MLHLQTVEVLATVIAHPPPAPTPARTAMQLAASIDQEPRDYCAACDNSHEYAFSVTCHGCAARMHSHCIGASGSVQQPLLCAKCCQRLTAMEVPGVAKTTLIVCPRSIKHQWLSEIRKHAPGLKVIEYQGQIQSQLSSVRGTRPFCCLTYVHSNTGCDSQACLLDDPVTQARA